MPVSRTRPQLPTRKLSCPGKAWLRDLLGQLRRKARQLGGSIFEMQEGADQIQVGRCLFHWKSTLTIF